MDNLLKALVWASYEVVYFIDCRKKQYRKILAKPAIDLLYPKTGEPGDAEWCACLDRVWPEDREKLIREMQPEYIRQTMKENDRVAIPYRWLSPDGKTLYRKAVIISCPDDVGYLCAIRDMTEEIRQHMESSRNLRLKEEGIRFIVENMCENFIIVDTRTRCCTTYTHNSRIVCKDDFDEQVRWFSENLVVPEEMENYCRYFDMDSLMAKIVEEGGICRTRCTVDYGNDRHTIAVTSTMIADPENGMEPSFLFLCAQDVTSIKRMEEANRQLLFNNQHDKLTGLMNRFTTEKRVHDYLCSASDGTDGTFILIDIDRFKSINDRYGHLIGDDVLRFMGQSMKQVFRSEDILCRWGGDEFVVFVKGFADEKVMRDRLDILREKMDAFICQGTRLGVTLSIGGVSLRSETTLNRLFQLADEALYEVKNHGRNSVTFRQIS